MPRLTFGRDIVASKPCAALGLRRAPACPRVAPGRAEQQPRKHLEPVHVAQAPLSSSTTTNGTHSAPAPVASTSSRDASEAAAASALSANLLLM